MDIKAIVTSQYLATLEMMKQVISKCPDELGELAERLWAEAGIEVGWVGPTHQ